MMMLGVRLMVTMLIKYIIWDVSLKIISKFTLSSDMFKQSEI